MSSAEKLKVIALGTTATPKRLNACTARGGLDLVCFSRMTDMVSRLQQEKYDVILVDSLHEEAFSACRDLVEMTGSPVVLLVNEAEVNWQNLYSWSVDGFLSDKSGETEMVARITALARRSKKLQVA
jgi:DNA-binding response OmpR family regulator